MTANPSTEREAQQLLADVLKSSKNPSELSLTVKGVILAFVPLMLTMLRQHGYHDIDEGGLIAIIDLFTLLVQESVAVTSLAMTTWGLVRKVFNKKYFQM